MSFIFYIVATVIVCLCNGVSEKRVRRAIERGAATRRQVTSACGAGGACGGCHGTIVAMLKEQSLAVGATSNPAPTAANPDSIVPSQPRDARPQHQRRRDMTGGADLAALLVSNLNRGVLHAGPTPRIYLRYRSSTQAPRGTAGALGTARPRAGRSPAALAPGRCDTRDGGRKHSRKRGILAMREV